MCDGVCSSSHIEKCRSFFFNENKKTGLWNSIECWPIKRQGTWHASFPVRFVPSMIRRSLELAASLLRHRSAAETRHKSHDGNLLPSLCLCLFAVQHLYISHPVVLFLYENVRMWHSFCTLPKVSGWTGVSMQKDISGRNPMNRACETAQP